MATSKRGTSSGRALAVSLESERVRYNALIQSIGEGLIVIDEVGNIEHANPYALGALGFSESELVGRWFPAAIVVIDEYGQVVDPIARPMARALTEGTAVSEYANFLRKDGSLLPVLITASPLIIDGKPAGAIEVFRDLTRERELDIAKDEFVSIASHQLRTPATGIRGILSMLLQGDFGELEPVQQKYLKMAAQSNDRQLAIIEDLLSVARADAGSMDLHLQQTNLTQLVQDALADHRIILTDNRQQLESQLAPDLHAAVDSEKLKMVLDNLLSNASKYTPQGGTISINLSSSGDCASISVHDDGVGIPKDKQRIIFTKFMRVDNELSVPAGGTGLGLYLALKIIKLHRGEITVQSSPGAGSTFSVRLPLINAKDSL